MTDTQMSKAELLDFITQIGEAIDCNDPKKVLERVKKLPTSRVSEVTNLQKKLVQMLSNEYGTMELLLTELTREKKRFKLMLSTLTAVFVILTLENIIHLFYTEDVVMRWLEKASPFLPL